MHRVAQQWLDDPNADDSKTIRKQFVSQPTRADYKNKAPPVKLIGGSSF